jgi:transcriptional regulator GlxA family with amidase domain
MKIAFIVFNGITWLDLIGVYDPVTRLKAYNYIPDLSWDVCAFTTTAADNNGLEIIPDKTRNNLAEYDAIIIPGGHGTRKLQFDTDFINWIKTAENTAYKISICTGSLILGAAGFLKEKKATTNYQEYEALKPYCKEVSTDRVVDDNNVITAGAVSASIDLGLYLCRKWVGDEAESFIRRKMDYRG